MKIKRDCTECEFACETSATYKDGDVSNTYECRESPPQFYINNLGDFSSRYPPVNKHTQRCSRFKERQATDE